MSNKQISVLVWGSYSVTKQEYQRELSQFDIFFTNEPLEAAEKFSDTKILLIEVPNPAPKEFFASITRLKSEKTDHLIWIMVGTLDANALKNLAQTMREVAIQHWRYMKRPLLAGELAVVISFLLDEEIESARSERFKSFKMFRNALRGIAHELANLTLRVISRTDLAQMTASAGDLEKTRIQLGKLQEAGEASKGFVEAMQSFARGDFKPSFGKISTSLQNAVRGFSSNAQIHLEIASNIDEASMALENAVDSDLLTEGFSKVLSYVSQDKSSIKVIAHSEKLKGCPGLGIRFQFTHQLPGNLAHDPFEFGLDLRLPVARQIIELHGGVIHLQAQEISVWLPGMYQK